VSGFKAFIADLATTNLVIFSGVCLAWATLVASWLGWQVPSGWLVFVAAHMGIGTAQFSAKRLTHPAFGQVLRNEKP